MLALHTEPDFEEKLGQSLEELKAEAFQRDPRKCIADFFTMGDSPLACLCRNRALNLLSVIHIESVLYTLYTVSKVCYMPALRAFRGSSSV